jgi:SAM-dependent methyltransferase
MNLSAQEKTTAKTYDIIAQQWALKHHWNNIWERDLEYFHHLLPEGKLLEIGAGGGRDAKELIKYGYDYIGIDVSDGLLQEARKAVSEATFLHYSIYNLNSFKDYFDGFWTAATLLHIPKGRIDVALQNIHSAMKPQAIGFISMKQGRGEVIEEVRSHDNQTLKRFMAYYELHEFESILKRNKFKILKSETKISDVCTWLIYLVEVLK